MFELLKALLSIKLDRAALIALILADTIGLGVLAIMLCWPDRFVQLDVVKLIFMAIAITLPFVTLGTFAFHSGVIGHDYEVAQTKLQGSVIFAMAMHLFFSMATFFAIGMREAVPPPAWIPRPASSSIYWVFSGLYIFSMFCLGLDNGRPNKWLRRCPLLLVVLSSTLFFGIAYGAHRGYWSAPNTWPAPPEATQTPH